MYCGLKDPGWILVQLSQNSSEQQNVHFLTAMPPLELSVLDFFSYWGSSFTQEEPLWASHQTKEIEVPLQVKNYLLSIELIMRSINFFIFG